MPKVKLEGVTCVISVLSVFANSITLPLRALVITSTRLVDTPAGLLGVDYLFDVLMISVFVVHLYRGKRRLVEMFAFIPFDMMVDMLGYEGNFGFFRLNHLLAVVPLWRNLRIAEGYFWRMSVQMRRTMYILLALPLASHWCGCFWFYVAYLERDEPVAWFNQPMYPQYYNTSATLLYLRSVYWGSTLLITVGFGDVTAVTLIETIFSILAIYIGVLISCAAIASVVKLMEHNDRNDMALQEMLDDVCGYLEWRGASVELQDRAITSAKAAFIFEIKATGAELDTQLPYKLRSRLQIEQEEVLIHGVPRFQHLTKSVRTAISEQVVYVNKGPGEVVFNAGQVMDGLYYLRVGKAEFREGETVLKPLECGEYVGEEAIFGKGERANYTIVCSMACEFVFLSTVKFRELMQTNKALLGIDDDGGDDQDEMLQFGLNSSARHSRRRRCRVTASDWLPDSMFRRFWTLICFCGLLYNIYAVPRDCAFYRSHNRFENPDHEAMADLTIFWIFDVFFAVDFFLHCRRFAVEHDGTIITNRNKIRNIYLHSVWFYIDFVSILPLDLLCLVDTMQNIPFYRLNKVLRFLHVIEYFRVTESLLLSRFHIHVFARRIIRILSILVLSGYIVGCFWYYVAEITGTQYPNATWVYMDQTNPDFYFQSYVHNRLYIIRSMYFGYIGGSTLGFGDIVPVNPYETLVATIMLLYGAIIKPALVGSVASLLLTRNKAKISQQKTLVGFKWLVTAHKLPEVLKERIMMYFEFMWDNQYYEKEASILELLPELRSEIMQTICRNTYPKAWFFYCINDDTMRVIYSFMHPQLYMPYETISIPNGTLGILNTGSIYRSSSENDKHEIFEECTLTARTFALEKFILYNMATEQAELVMKNHPYVYSTGGAFCEALVLEAAQVYDAITSSIWNGLVQDMLLHLESAQIPTLEVVVPMPDDPAEKSKAKTVLPIGIRRPSPTRKQFFMKPAMKSAATKEKDVLRGSKFHPKSRYRRVLSVLVVIALLYNAFLVPFRLAFFSSLLPPSYLYGFLVDYVLDLIFILDVFTKYKYKVMQLHLEPSIVRVHWTIWKSLKWDIICAFPIEIFFIGVISSNPDLLVAILTICRLPKVFRLRYFVVRIRELANTAIRARPQFNDFVVACRYFLFILFFSHILACAWHYLAFADKGILPWSTECNKLDNTHVSDDVNNETITLEAECLFEGTWIEFQMKGGYLPDNGGTIWERYSRCFNFGIQMLLVVSSGIIVPVNMVETLFCIIAIFAGIFFSAGKIGVIGEIALKVDSLSASIRQSTDALSKYMAFHGVPKSLQDKALGFMEYLYRKRNKILFQEEEIVKLLPLQLQRDILSHCKLDRLQACPLFANVLPQIQVRLAAEMKHRYYAPGDIVVHENRQGRCMYFVKPGSCQYQDPSIPSAKSKSLSAFGERSLLLDEPHPHTICSCTFTEVYVLKDSGLATLATEFPDLENILLKELENQPCENDDEIEGSTSKLHEDTSIQAFDGLNNTEKRSWQVPDSHFRRVWDVLLYCTTLYVLIILPLRAAYLVEDHLNALDELLVWYSGDALSILLYATDTYLSYNHFAFMDHSKLIYNRDKIRENYQSYLLLDFFTIAPFWVFAFIWGLSSLKFLMLPLVLRAKRFPRYLRRFSRNFQYYFFRLSGSVIHILHCILYYSIMIHWWACIWMFLHRYVERNSPLTWAVRDPYMGGSVLSVWNATTHSHNICSDMKACYVRAYYFVISFVGTVGFGDVRTGGHLEYFFEDIEALFGSFFFAAITSCFASYFQYADTFGKGATQTKLSGLASYFRAAHTTKPTCRAIVTNAKLWCVRTGGLVEPSVATYLPVPLRVELAAYVQRSLLTSSPFLSSCDWFLRNRIVLAVHFQVVCAGSIIYSQGDQLDEVAFIHDGRIKLSDHNGNCLQGSTGSHVGRGVPGACLHTVHALDHVELYVLDDKGKSEVFDSISHQMKLTLLARIDDSSLHASQQDHELQIQPRERSMEALADEEDVTEEQAEIAEEPPAWLALPQSFFK